MSRILTIAGTHNTPSEWKNLFLSNVVMNAKGLPSGSIGCSWDAGRDLDELWKECAGKLTRFMKELKTVMGDRSHNAGQLKDWYMFLKDDSPYFIIRRGKTGLWLCKKVGSYYFSPRTPTSYEHRVRFEAIAEVEGVEVGGQKTIQFATFDLTPYLRESQPPLRTEEVCPGQKVVIRNGKLYRAD